MDEKKLKSIKKFYKFKNKISNSIVKNIIFLLIFFIVFYTIINLNLIISKTKYFTQNLISKIYQKFIIDKKEPKTKSEISKPKIEDTKISQKESMTEEKIDLDKEIDKQYQYLANLYKKVYGVDYERYLKRDLVKKVYSKYYTTYGDEADFFLREDYNYNKPEVEKRKK